MDSSDTIWFSFYGLTWRGVRVYNKEMKDKCVKCKTLLPKGNYELRGNWCAWCDAKATVTKRPDIGFFIKIAKHFL